MLSTRSVRHVLPAQRASGWWPAQHNRRRAIDAQARPDPTLEWTFRVGAVGAPCWCRPQTIRGRGLRRSYAVGGTVPPLRIAPVPASERNSGPSVAASIMLRDSGTDFVLSR